MNWTQEMLSEEVKKHEAWLMRQPGVTGVGVGLSGKGVVLQVMTDQMDAATMASVRKRLGAAPVEFVSTGPIEAQG
jgi:hypothetical protein